MIFWLLLSGAAVLNIVLLFFGHSTAVPLDAFDFWFLLSLLFGFSLFRPGWSFLLFLSLLPFETLNLAPEAFGITVRPYQIFAVVIAVAMVIRRSVNRLGSPFSFRWFDVLPLIFACGGFISALCAEHPGSALKQAMVSASFVAVYILSRQFLSQKEDVRRIVPFLMLSGALAGLYAVIQNIRFSRGLDSFEAMPGRPNAFFPEADWLGMYLIFFESLVFVGIASRWGRRAAFSSKQFLGQSRKQGLSQGINALSVFERFALVTSQLREQWTSSSCVARVNHFGAHIFLFLTFCLSMSALILTVARSAWIGMAAVIFVGFGAALFLMRKELLPWQAIVGFIGTIVASIVVSIGAVSVFHLTSFELSHRTMSAASGWQGITVSCDRPVELPERIDATSELLAYSCRFIRLEDIESERSLGHSIQRVLRPDPSISARRDIFSTVAEQIQMHPIFGIGWGSIGDILGIDDRGVRLNASNAFLETWLGGGLFSLLAFLVLWFLVPAFALIRLFGTTRYAEERMIALFFLSSWVGFSCFNLFNSGLFLGFFWVWLGGIGLIAPDKS